jgi:hypothetical protein
MWGDLVIDSVRRPRVAARRILDAGVPDALVVEAALLVTCAGIVLGYFALRAAPEGVDMVSAALLANPLLGAGAQLAAMAFVIFLTVRIGRLFGGSGELWGAAALVVWLNAMLVLVQAGQLVALALLPPVAALLAIAAMIWGLWAYASFVAELHGFKNPAIVLGAVILTGIVLFFGAAMLFAILGLTPRETG